MRKEVGLDQKRNSYDRNKIVWSQVRILSGPLMGKSRIITLESLRKGVDLLTLSRLLGHTSLQLLLRYAKQNKLDLGNSYKSVIDD